MSEAILSFHFDVDGNNFTSAGQASVSLKKDLQKLGLAPELIRRVCVAMYEGEINMVIHAGGGVAEVYITEESIKVVLKDEGPGIPDVNLAMQEGYSTASREINMLGFGAGMGLPNMKRFTDDMKISTEVGKGTEIEMTVFLDEKSKGR